MVRKGMQHFPFRKAVQFFWKGIGLQYQSGKVERNGKGKEIESKISCHFLSATCLKNWPTWYIFFQERTGKMAFTCTGGNFADLTKV